jgi:hypothetical protein
VIHLKINEEWVRVHQPLTCVVWSMGCWCLVAFDIDANRIVLDFGTGFECKAQLLALAQKIQAVRHDDYVCISDDGRDIRETPAPPREEVCA